MLHLIGGLAESVRPLSKSRPVGIKSPPVNKRPRRHPLKFNSHTTVEVGGYRFEKGVTNTRRRAIESLPLIFPLSSMPASPMTTRLWPWPPTSSTSASDVGLPRSRMPSLTARPGGHAARRSAVQLLRVRVAAALRTVSTRVCMWMRQCARASRCVRACVFENVCPDGWI